LSGWDAALPTILDFSDSSGDLSVAPSTRRSQAGGVSAGVIRGIISAFYACQIDRDGVFWRGIKPAH